MNKVLPKHLTKLQEMGNDVSDNVHKPLGHRRKKNDEFSLTTNWSGFVSLAMDARTIHFDIHMNDLEIRSKSYIQKCKHDTEVDGKAFIRAY